MKLQALETGDLEKHGFIFRCGFTLPGISYGKKHTNDFGEHNQVGISLPTTFNYSENRFSWNFVLQLLGFGIYWVLVIKE